MPSLEDMPIDQLLAHAQRTQSSHDLLTSLTSNPKTREMIQQALKTVNPNLVIPELDAKAVVRAEIEEIRKDNAKLRNEILEKDIRERLERQRATIKTKYGLTDDDVTKVEQIMTREVDPIPSYEAAAQVFNASRQQTTPTSANLMPPTFTLPEKDVWGAGIGNKSNLDKIAMTEAFAAWNEISSGKAGLGAPRAN